MKNPFGPLGGMALKALKEPAVGIIGTMLGVIALAIGAICLRSCGYKGPIDPVAIIDTSHGPTGERNDPPPTLKPPPGDAPAATAPTASRPGADSSPVNLECRYAGTQDLVDLGAPLAITIHSGFGPIYIATRGIFPACDPAHIYVTAHLTVSIGKAADFKVVVHYDADLQVEYVEIPARDEILRQINSAVHAP